MLHHQRTSEPEVLCTFLFYLNRFALALVPIVEEQKGALTLRNRFTYLLPNLYFFQSIIFLSSLLLASQGFRKTLGILPGTI
jgi:hypothetical protein